MPSWAWVLIGFACGVAVTILVLMAAWFEIWKEIVG